MTWPQPHWMRMAETRPPSRCKVTRGSHWTPAPALPPAWPSGWNDGGLPSGLTMVTAEVRPVLAGHGGVAQRHKRFVHGGFVAGRGGGRIGPCFQLLTRRSRAGWIRGGGKSGQRLGVRETGDLEHLFGRDAAVDEFAAGGVGALGGQIPFVRRFRASASGPRFGVALQFDAKGRGSARFPRPGWKKPNCRSP